MLRGGHFLEAQFHIRGLVSEAGQGGGEEGVHGRVDEAEGEAAGQACAYAFGQGGGFVGQGQDMSGLVGHGLSGRGQGHAAAGAGEKRRAQGVFDVADALAKGWLGHVEPGGGPAEVQFLGHGQDVAEIAQFHGLIATAY